VRNEAIRCVVVSLMIALTSGVSVWAGTGGTKQAITAQANRVAEVTLTTATSYANPFIDVMVDALVTTPDGRQLKVPAYWAGGKQWRFRYASGSLGEHRYRTECSDTTNPGLHGVEGKLEVVAYRGVNPLYRHGPVRVGKDGRHFEHSDGTPFFWLGDTWWKNLCKRMTWEGFQELTADRQGKGFSVVHIVCGVYPDEPVFEPSWENEGGKPYETRDFTVVNPTYFEYADRRIEHLVEAGIAPAIVGSWKGSQGYCNGMAMAGVAGMKRHWRNLVARYGAYPTIWIIGGESAGPKWTEVARYVQEIDPYGRAATLHPHSYNPARRSVTDKTVINFDMLTTWHGGWAVAKDLLPKVKASYNLQPAMPVVIGEQSYEGHMQTGFADVQRYVFWSSMVSGFASGLTYGAAGVWHASVEGDPGLTHVYDLTTWKKGMHFPGSTQLGLGKKLLEEYAWWRFEPHPEWVEEGCFASGICGEVRFIYQPRRNTYNWEGPKIKNLERDVPYSAFYFDPVSGRRFDRGTIVNPGPRPYPFEGHAEPRLFADRFEIADVSAWKDYGTPSHRQEGRLVGGKGMVSLVEKIEDADLIVSVDAKSDAEAGIILRFHNPDEYLVGFYSPSLKGILFHDRTKGKWGPPLGKIDVPEIGPNIHLTAAACGDQAALLLTDGTTTYQTPMVKVSNVKAGNVGLWFYQIGDRQDFDNFEVSPARLAPVQRGANEQAQTFIWSGEGNAPPVPSPQDWVLVLERKDP